MDNATSLPYVEITPYEKFSEDTEIVYSLPDKLKHYILYESLYPIDGEKVRDALYSLIDDGMDSDEAVDFVIALVRQNLVESFQEEENYIEGYVV